MSPSSTRKSRAQTTQDQAEGKEYPLYNLSRRVLLASIGAVALAQDEIERFISKLVERGEIAEKDAKKLIDEIREKRGLKTLGMEKQVRHRMDKVLQGMDIPTKADIQDLSDRIAALSKKIDEITRSTSS
jgi:polyhydroxyalkanoate synthesis regulator phasin